MAKKRKKMYEAVIHQVRNGKTFKKVFTKKFRAINAMKKINYLHGEITIMLEEGPQGYQKVICPDVTKPIGLVKRLA